MIFTENSPLVPMFYQATIQAFESGAYDRLSLNWQGGPIKPIGAVDLLILTPGQVFLIFGIMCFFMVTAIFAFFLEWCCHCLKKKYGKKHVHFYLVFMFIIYNSCVFIYVIKKKKMNTYYMHLFFFRKKVGHLTRKDQEKEGSWRRIGISSLQMVNRQCPKSSFFNNLLLLPLSLASCSKVQEIHALNNLSYIYFTIRLLASV